MDTIKCSIAKNNPWQLVMGPTEPRQGNSTISHTNPQEYLQPASAGSCAASHSCGSGKSLKRTGQAATQAGINASFNAKFLTWEI